MNITHARHLSARSFSAALAPLAAALAILCAALPARAACPPAVTGLTATSSICGGNILLTFDPPASGLNFPQIFSASFPDVFFAHQIATGSLQSTSFDAPSLGTEIPTYYWVRWQGLDSACPTRALTGPVRGVSVSPGLASVGGSPSLIAPGIAVGCTSITLFWQRFRESFTATIVRIPLSGPGANIAQTLGTFPGTVTSFIDSTGSPGLQYDYKVLYSAAACGLTNAASQPGRVFFPPFTSVPVITPADVLAGSSATLSVNFPALSPGFGPAPQWFRGPTLITDIPGRISGASTTALTFTPALAQDQGIYTLRTATACGQLTPIPVSLIVRAGCPADFNADAHLGVDDIFAFLSAWFAGCP